MSCGAPGPRPLMEQAYHRLAQGGADTVVAIAPTSYGKTAASPWMWRRAVEERLTGGLVHVAPLRSLIHRIYKDFFEPCGARMQAHGVDQKHKSPYFLADLVVSTLDSFLWNLYKIPVAEAIKVIRGKSMGHYYPALAAIMSSLIVFDEAHMYLWEEASDRRQLALEASLAAIAALSKLGVPVLVETATLHPQAIHALARRLYRHAPMSVEVLRAPGGARHCPYVDTLKEALGPRNVAVDVVVDREWEEKLVDWRTRLIDNWPSILDEIVDEASRAPVLVVVNTVVEAVSIYSRLRDRVDRAILLHGRLSEADRKHGEDAIKSIEKRGGVVIATQVAEAGVDINSLVVYTSAAPIENIAQRAGRACRRGRILEECRAGEGARLTIVVGANRGPYMGHSVNEAMEALKRVLDRGWGIDWRATCDHNGHRSYASILASTRSSPDLDLVLADILEDYLRGDAQPWVILRQLDRAGLCSLVRGSAMVEVDVGVSIVVASLDWVLENASQVLEMESSGPLIVIEEAEGGTQTIVARRLWETWTQSRRVSCTRLLKSLLEDITATTEVATVASYRFIARQDAYIEGLGLLLSREKKAI